MSGSQAISGRRRRKACRHFFRTIVEKAAVVARFLRSLRRKNALANSR
jgi:hypothetical protein